MADSRQSVLQMAQGSSMGHILLTLQQQADAKGQIDWEMHYLDSTVIQAQQPFDGCFCAIRCVHCTHVAHERDTDGHRRSSKP
jgi:hypothetical protein